MTDVRERAREGSANVDAEQIAVHLRPVLVDLIALGLNGKQAHWHVHGKTFTQLHEQLDSFVTEVRGYADDVAERVVALGLAVDGTPSAVAQGTTVASFPTGFVDVDKVVEAVVGEIDAAIGRARQTLQPLDEIDPVSQDVVLDVLRGLEKQRWMFEAHVS